MAAFVKSVNAKIRANPMLNYVCSTRTFPSQLLPHFYSRAQAGFGFERFKADKGNG
jgi:hypothetical protein